MPEKTKKIDKWRLPLIVGALVVLAAVIAVGIGVLIAHDRKPQPTPAAFASKTPSPTAVAPSDPHGRKACELNKNAYDQDTLKDDAVVLRILHEAQQSSNQSIQFAAQMLADRQALSNSEIKRGGNDLDMVLGGQRASIEMQTDCLNAGYA